MEKLENKNDLYYVYELNESLDEKELRKLLLQNEVEHIQNNITDYVSGDIELVTQCETLKDCLKLPIENIINNLETWWSYSISKLNYNTYITNVTFKPTTTLEQVNTIIQTIQNNYSRDYVKVTEQSPKFFDTYIKGCSKGFCITLEHRSSNIDINDIENLLDNCDDVLQFKYQYKKEN